MMKSMLSLFVVVSFLSSSLLHAAPSSQPVCAEAPALERKILDKLKEIDALKLTIKDQSGRILTLDGLMKLYEENQALYESAGKNRIGIIETQQKIINDLEASVGRKWYEHPALWIFVGISATLAAVAAVVAVGKQIQTNLLHLQQ